MTGNMNRIVSVEEYLSLPREAEQFLIRPLLPRSGSLLLYGDPKVGKSYAAIQLASALSTGGAWLGFDVPPPSGGPVVYIQLDTPRSLWADRVGQLTRSGLDLSKVYLADRETLDTFPFDILDVSHSSTLRGALSSLESLDKSTGELQTLPFPSVVIIDTIRESHSADENDSTAMRNVIAALTAAVQPAALIVVSHSRKPGEQGRDLINDNRGSSYVVGRMDAIVSFRPKSIVYQGRAIEEGSVLTERLDNGLWEPKSSNVERHIKGVLHDDRYPTIRAKARRLAELTNRSEESCRSTLRRVIYAEEPTQDVTHPLESMESTTYA